MRLYALYNCSKKLLIFMMTFYLGEVGIMMWILIASNILSGRELSDTSFISDLDPFVRNYCGDHFVPRSKNDPAVRQSRDQCVLIYLGPLSYF